MLNADTSSVAMNNAVSNIASSPFQIAGAAIVLTALLSGCAQDSVAPAAPGVSPAAFVGSATCAGCHAEQHQAWSESHHAKAMQPATGDTVRGDFANAEFKNQGVIAFFRRDGDAYVVRTAGPDGETTDFPVRYTFGVEPLQQYLLEMPDGRLQALDIAWDSRSKSQGGQRWFHLRPEEQLPVDDPLHWTGLLQNWNSVCADCHSTDLQKNYDAQTDTYATRWSDVNVGCEACHGAGSAHAEAPADTSLRLASTAQQWAFAGNATIARLASDATPGQELETCAACHSRRSQLTDAVLPGDPLLDGFRPALLDAPLYYPDGQIRDEVFVYGSFLQSRMHRAGVTCSDCHEPHSAAVRADGNALCAGCHQPAAFDTPEHHHHPVSSPGAQCVNCHMRAETYMGVDPRRDHSFRVPRPDLSAQLSTPNACNDCHAEPASWAAERVADWYPEGRSGRFHYGEALHAGQQWAANREALLRQVINNTEQPAIVRATAIRQLAEQPDSDIAGVVGAALDSNHALIRLAALDSLFALPPDTRATLAAKHLVDEPLALRLAAAEALLPNRDSLNDTTQQKLAAAVAELADTQQFNFDRAEGWLGRAQLDLQLGNVARAEEALRIAVERHPAYIATYSNLADLYRATGRNADAERTLHQGLVVSPRNPALTHALGLALVRTGNSEQALARLREARDMQTDNPRYAYVYAIALNSLAGSDAAMSELLQAYARFPGFAPIVGALATISLDQGDRVAALGYAQQLVELSPLNPVGHQIVRELTANPMPPNAGAQPPQP